MTEKGTVIKNLVDSFRRALGSGVRSIAHDRAARKIHGQAEFEIVVMEDPVDGGYVAVCENLPGAASQGETVEEALENLTDAIGGVVAARLDRYVRESESNEGVLVEHHKEAHVTIPLELLDRERVPALAGYLKSRTYSSIEMPAILSWWRSRARLTFLPSHGIERVAL